MSNKKQRSEVTEFRFSVGVHIIMKMIHNEEFPMPNKNRLTKTMQEYFDTLGMQDIVHRSGYTWAPTADYWYNQLNEIRDALRKRKKMYLTFVRTEGTRGFDGAWRFATKEEYYASLKTEHRDIYTRASNHNEKLTDGQEKWRIDLPLIDKVPLLN